MEDGKEVQPAGVYSSLYEESKAAAEGLVMEKILKEAVDLCKEILIRMGVREEDIFLGTVNAGHPGGMFPLKAEDKETLHSRLLPENLYISDATILP